MCGDNVSRFEIIKKFLHFSNNEEAPANDDPSYDRAYKVRYVINHLNRAFQNCREPEKQQSIDERMVKFKGHNIMRQFIKSKPVKWGFKLWMRCGSKSGYTHDIDVYTGKSNDQSSSVGLGEKVVFNLTKSLIGTGCMVFMDNFFVTMFIHHSTFSWYDGYWNSSTKQKKFAKKFEGCKEMKRGEVAYLDIL